MPSHKTTATPLAASVVLLCALLCTSCQQSSGGIGDGIDQADVGDIKFSVAQDYPASTVTYNGTASPGAVAYLYRDGHADPYADLVMANLGGGPVVLYGIGDGKFTAQRTVIDNADTDASAVEVADFNADGIPDIVSGGYTTLQITVMLGRTDGSFGVSGQYPLQGQWVSQFQIADLNRDGHLDIATSAYGGGTITILLGNGDGSFVEAPPVPATTVALALLVADFDGDAIPDMAVTETSPTLETPAVLGEASGNLLHGEVHILLGNGDGTFRPTDAYPIGALSELIRYGDLDEDGNKDLVIFNALINNEASILYGLGGGRFAPEQRMRIGGPSSINILDVRSADGAEGLQLLDFNGDGHLDMAVTQMISSRLVIFQGDGRGHFTPAGSYDVAGFPEDLMAGDLNGDGCPDLAVPGNVPPIGPSDVGVGRVSVLLNLSAGCL
ncbi:MAG: VCBS repeat-containing protein [Sinimarinibacterium sp.]